MSKTFTAPFAQTTKTATAVCTEAVAALTTDAPTNTVLLLTAGAEGGLLTRLSALPRATVTAASLCLWLSTDNGATKRLIDSALMSAFTVAATTAIVVTEFSRYSEYLPLRLEAGAQLYVGSQVALAGGIVFKAEYADF